LDLSVIIVNYNVKYFLEQCLCSVKKACRNIDAEIIVVDNHSTDGSRSFLEQSFRGVKFTWNDANTGFAKANNQALSQAQGKYILFLNPDTILAEDAISTCFNFFEQNKQAGAVGVRMIDGSGQFLKESKRAFPSPLTSFYKLSGLAKLFPRSKTFARYHLGHLSENKNHEVDVLAGAFMMMPKAVLDITGSFDETFFMYGEDVDLSYRVQAAGYKNFYLADTTIIHFKGESTKKGSLNYVRLFYKAMSLFVKKHYSGSKAGIFHFFVQLAIVGRAAVALLVKLLQRIGLFLSDAGIILLSFITVKYFWSTYIKQEVDYSPNVLLFAFPVFTLIFLIAAYYSGLYDKGYKSMQLVKSTLVALLLLLSGYALLPEPMRFSRGILVLGIIVAFVCMNWMRWLFKKAGILESAEESELQQTIVVANEVDFQKVMALMRSAGMEERVLGRVHKSGGPQVLGSWQQLPQLIEKYPVKEVIFCEDGLSYKEIIGIVQQLPPGLRNKFHGSGSSSIIGSDSKDMSGDYVAVQKKYVLGLPLNKRKKNGIDVLVALLFIISFPAHLLLQKKPGRFFKQVWEVLTRRKTWIGYATANNALPKLKPGVLTSTTLPNALNELPEESLRVSDEWYAGTYDFTTDLKKIWRGYRYLSY